MRRATVIRTTLGKEYEVSLEMGDKVRQAIASEAKFIMINKVNKTIVRVNSILEVDDVSISDKFWGETVKDDHLIEQKPHQRASLDSPSYKRYKKTKQKLLDNIS